MKKIPTGVRRQAVVKFNTYIQEQLDNGYSVPKPVVKYVKASLKKERFFDIAFSKGV
jgi:hypothetical protein